MITTITIAIIIMINIIGIAVQAKIDNKNKKQTKFTNRRLFNTVDEAVNYYKSIK